MLCRWSSLLCVCTHGSSASSFWQLPYLGMLQSTLEGAYLKRALMLHGNTVFPQGHFWLPGPGASSANCSGKRLGCSARHVSSTVQPARVTSVLRSRCHICDPSPSPTAYLCWATVRRTTLQHLLR